MADSAFFVQECPTCGRSLRVRVEYLGKRLICQHCRGSLMAHGPGGPHLPADDRQGLLARAGELIDRAERRLARPR